MSSFNGCIRLSEPSDLVAIQAIYAEQVLHGTASFEEIPPNVNEMLARRSAVLELDLPYIVAEQDQQIVGYAYASLYRTRSAYRHTLEDTVYVHADFRGQGTGKLLLNDLIVRCQQQNYREMIGIVGDSENQGSIRLHQACGFTIVGTLRRVGFKHGRWLDTVIMQLPLTSATTLTDSTRDPDRFKNPRCIRI